MTVRRDDLHQRQQAIHHGHTTQHREAEEQQQSAVGERDGIACALVDERDSCTRAKPKRNPLAHGLASRA